MEHWRTLGHSLTGFLVPHLSVALSIHRGRQSVGHLTISSDRNTRCYMTFPSGCLWHVPPFSTGTNYNSFIHQWLYSPLLSPGLFFSFVIDTQTAGLLGRGISSLQGRYLHTEQHKQNKRTQTFMPRVGSESTTPVFERSKTVHCLRLCGHCERQNIY
jgi:hypothetical protein